MGILNDVLAYKERKDAEAQADMNAIPQAIGTFMQARQQANKNLLDQLTLQANMQKFSLDAQKAPYEMEKLQAETAKANAESGLLGKFFGQNSGNGDIQATEATVGGVKFENKKLKDQANIDSKNLEVDTAIKKDALTRFSKLDELIPLLDQFDEQLNSIPVDKGVKGKFQGLELQAKGALGVDPFAAANFSQIDSTRALAARAFGDVGNLSQPEQENAKKFFAQGTDPADTRVLKALGGLTLLKKKFTQTADKAGLASSDLFKNKLSQIDERIGLKMKQAKELGIDPKRLSEFVGSKNESTSSIPDGTIGTAKDGTPVIRKDGKWVTK